MVLIILSNIKSVVSQFGVEVNKSVINTSGNMKDSRLESISGILIVGDNNVWIYK